MSNSPTKVAIVGAGKGGIALLELLHQIPDIEIVGIAIWGATTAWFVSSALAT